MELITGAPPAEFGDKTSLIVNAVTKSGLGQKPNGSFLAQWSSFGTYSEEATLALGGAKVGNFLAVNALRSGRFLDTPEFTPIHDDRQQRHDLRPLRLPADRQDAFHLNLFAARNWFQIPNTYDQLGQDQRQKISTFNFAPGYQHTFGAKTLLTVNPFYRQRSCELLSERRSRSTTRRRPSPGPDSDQLGREGRRVLCQRPPQPQGRHATDADAPARALRVWSHGPLLQSPSASTTTAIRRSFPPSPIRTIAPRPVLRPIRTCFPDCFPYDLTRGGKLFQFDGSNNINQYAFYVQDSIKFGNLKLQAGLRVDSYHGIVSDYERAAAHRILLPDQADRNRAARLLLAHV